MAFWNFSKSIKIDKNDETLQPILIGSDLGYGQSKNVSGNIKEKFLSAVGTPVSNFGRTAAVVTKQELMDNLSLTFNGQTYYVGRNAIVNTRNGRFTLRQNKADDIYNIVKFITGLSLFMSEDQHYAEFDVITGLPVLEFKNQKDSLENMMRNDGKPFVFDVHYGPKTVRKTIYVKNVKIVSQGEGVFYDFILSDKGEIVNSRAEIATGSVMVCDVGFRTTDIVTMENGSYIEPLSDQFNKGVNQIHQEILRLIMERFGIKKELKDLDQIVRDKGFYHNTKQYDITKIIYDAAKPFAEDIVESLHTTSNDQLGGINHVIFAGGGAEIIFEHVKPLLNGIVNTSIMEDSEFCNAQGYYKYGLLLQNAQKQVDGNA